MSVSLLPSALLSSLRSLLLSLSCATRALQVSECRAELGALLKQFGIGARLFALQVAAHTALHAPHADGSGGGAHGHGPSAPGASPTSPHPHPHSPQNVGTIGSKALEAWVSEEVCALQAREPAKWPQLLAKVLEAAATQPPPHAHAHMQSTPGKSMEEGMLARFGAVANLSLRHLLSLAVQLHRSPLARLQSAGLHFVSQQLSWAALPSVNADNKAWAAVPDELLSELAFLVSSPAFPQEQRQQGAEHRQHALHALAKLQQSAGARDGKRDEAAEVTAAVGAHANATSHVADVLQDLGYSISSSIESLKDTLHPFPKLTEYDVASIIVMILRTQYAKLHSEGADESTVSAPPPAVKNNNKKDARGKQGGVSSLSSLSSAAAGGEGWQITNVIDAIKELTSSHSSSASTSRLNWRNILENEIDHPKLLLADEKSFCLYIDIYRYATTGVYANSAALPHAQQTFHLPSIEFLLRDWKHPVGHLSMLRWALPSTLTLFSYLPPTALANASAARNAKSILAAANTAGENAQDAEQDESSTLMSISSSGGAAMMAATPTSQKDAHNNRYQSWLSLDLLESLLESMPSSASSGGASSSSSTAQSLYASLRSLLSVALERCPELLITGLLSVRPKSKQLVVKDELISCMLPVHMSVAPHASTAQAFQKMWESSASAASASQLNASKAAVFWCMKYWMLNGSGSSAGSAAGAGAGVGAAPAPLLPPVLISLGNSLRSFLEKLLSGASTPFTMDLLTTAEGAGSAGGVSSVSFSKWLAHKYASEMTSNASKELFLSILFAYIKDNLSDAQASISAHSHGAFDVGVLPFRLSVESVAILLKTLLTLPHAPPSLINDVQNFYAQNSPHFQPLQAVHMQQIIGSTIALSTHAPQQPPQQQQQLQQQQQGLHGGMMGGQQQQQSQSHLSMGGGSNVGHGGHMGGQLNDTSLTTGSGGSTGASGGAAAPAGPSDEIEEEANTYFQKIYTGATSLDSVVEMLLRYRWSANKRERDVCLCMIHNLFDEYRFFSKYPLRELQITGLLFGALISHKLVSNFTLGIALRFVLEALRKPPDTKMFSFGLWAIQQFKERIQNWPQYAMLILHIPHMQAAQPELANFLQQIVINASSAEATAAASGEALDFSTHGTSSFGAGFHSDAQSFSTFASLTEAERHAEMQASAAKTALERATAAANADAQHLPPGLGIGGAVPKSTTPGPTAGASTAAASTTGAVARPAGAVTSSQSSSFGSTLNIDSLLIAEGDAPLPLAPSESVKDKIHFLVNNITKSNLRQKGRELKLILRHEYLTYFARYLVIKRVSIEANFQRLYAAFLDYVGVPDLRKVMLEVTYYNIQVLLRNDKIVSSSSERSLLKNLGSWLGLLTIAKNKPIRAKYLDVKTLILEAYDSGRLIAVIPFASKVLESCAESRVFKPPNPWLMAVVGLLREIFDLPGLKLNLKFEIEVLFNHLTLNMKEIKSTSLLQHRKMHVGNSRLNEKQQQQQRQQQQQQQQQNMQAGAPPFPLLPTPNPLPPLPKSGVPPLKSGVGTVARSPSPSMSEDEHARMGGLAGTGAFAPPAGGAAAAAAAAAAAPGAGPLSATPDSLLLPNLSQYVVMSPSISLFQMYPALKRCVPTAIDRAIREIINPVVERSLAIACVTSRELVLKDFAMEPDENKMRAASNSMVSNLTSSLALVTCKEPLRVSITNHLSQLLEQNTNPSERTLVERACMQIALDNLELGTTLIEKAAAERAIREIDEQLAPVYQMRLKHRQTTGQPFVDMSFFAPGNRYPAALPEMLRAKPGAGLSPAQLRVYDDFSRIRSQHAAAAAAAPQTGTDRPAAIKDATGAPVGGQGLPGSTSLLRPEDADKKAAATASAFAAPPSAAAARVGPGGVQQAPGVGIGAPGSNIPGAGAAPSTRSPPLGAASQPSNLTAQQTLDKLLGYLATLEQAVLRFPNHKSIPLHSLTSVAAAGQAAGQDQEINVLMRLMAALLTQTSRDESAYPKDLVPLTFALKVFKRLYERENRSSLLQIDVHIGVLKCVRAVCPKLLPELTAWLLYADDDRKFILPITAGLLRARLLNTAELDVFLSKLATQIFSSGQAVATTSQPNPAAPAGSNQTQQLQVLHPQLEFILTLVRRVVVKRPIVSVAELASLLETLNKIGQQAQQQRTKLLADHIAHLLEDVRTAQLLAEKERSEQERAARASAEGLDSKLGSVDPSLSGVLLGGVGVTPLSVLDGDESDSLDRLLELDEQVPSSFTQQVMYLLDDWMNICLQQGQASDKAYSAYLGLLQQQRLLATPDATQKFFRVIIQLCVDSALSSLSNAQSSSGSNADGSAASAPPSMSYTAIDALAKLFIFLLKFLEPPTAVGPNGQAIPSPNTTANKILLLRSFLSAAVFVLRKDQAQKSALVAQAVHNGGGGAAPASVATFNQRPYLRLFNNLLHDLNTPDPLLDSNNVEVLACFATHFRFLRPQRCPAFLFAWLELISHRMFMSKLLLSKQSGCSVLFARLLVDLFRFLQPYLRQADLTEVLRLAYKGTLRLLLVLLHDFPEFLCEFHSSFCDVIPPSCIQMRNLILSAFPRSMRLPDPFTPNLKVDLLPEMTQAPRISSDCSLLLHQPAYRHTLLLPLEHYLKHREPATFFKQMLDSLTLRSAVLNTPHNGSPSPAQLEAMHTQAVKRAGSTYNVPLINALVMYTGLAGIQSLLQSSGKSGLLSQFQDSAAMDVYEALLSGLDAEGRYYVLNAIANQLRFPNNHTHYFSCVLLYLFLQCSSSHKDEVLMEQMTRVLLERLIVHRPHPWGLLITFIELIKNPRYDFWRQPFTRCAPEIERLFESVARSCMPAKHAAGAAGATAGAQGAAGAQAGTNGTALGSSVGASNAGAAHLQLLNDSNNA